MTRHFLQVAVLLVVVFALASIGSPTVALAQDDMEFEVAGVERSGPPSKTLKRALKLYDRGDYYSASIALFKVINKKSRDKRPNRQRARFFMGKTLFQQKFYAGALAQFDHIVDQGGRHRYYGVTLKWLAALSEVLPESSGILDKIGKYSREDLEDPALNKVRDELYYLLGRHVYMQGNTQQAIDLFRTVAEDSKFYLPAKYMEGVSHVRELKGAPAIEAFKQILVVGAEPALRQKYTAKDVKKYIDLAHLAMARVFYSTKQFDTSIKYFEKIEQDSPYWTQSLFEASWAYFLRKSSSKTLGNIHTLNAPYFEEEFFPESIKIKAVVYFNLCRYTRAREAAAEFDKNFGPLRDALLEVVKVEEDDNGEFFLFAQRIRSGKSKLEKEVERLAATALQDKTLLKTFAFVEELDRELRQHDRADKAWKTTAVAADVLQDLTVQKSLAEAEAGRLARERLERLLKELNGHRREMRKVKFEILNAMAGQTTTSMEGGQLKKKRRDEIIRVDDEHQTWPFNGEYWKDELGFYRYRISSQCVNRK